MDTAQICRVYRCLCELPRLRILNLLQARGADGLCVCHLQEILGEPQVKVSKHLKYLRAGGLVRSERRANWTVYFLASAPDPVLKRNLKCLRDLHAGTPVFRDDLRRMAAADLEAGGSGRSTPEPCVC